MRRIVATLLVVASPLLMAAPVTAKDGRMPGPVAPEVATAPAAPEAVATPPAAPGALQVTPPAPASPALVTPPAAPAPVRVVPPAAPAAARPAAAKVVPPRAPVPAAVSDAVYAERLQAELCVARQVFCGLTHDGRYRAG